MNHSTIKFGSKGPDVRAWERVLGMEACSEFDSIVENETKEWQAAHGLTPDGIVGPLTWAAAFPSVQVPRVQTSLSGTGLMLALGPCTPRTAVAWSQLALEHAHGHAIYNNNLGNVTAFGSWSGEYYVVTTSEQVKPGVWKPVNMRFRSHASIAEGVADYWSILSRSYGTALDCFDAGLPGGAAEELHKAHYYTADMEPYRKAMMSLYREALAIQAELGAEK